MSSAAELDRDNVIDVDLGSNEFNAQPHVRSSTRSQFRQHSFSISG